MLGSQNAGQVAGALKSRITGELSHRITGWLRRWDTGALEHLSLESRWLNNG